MRPATVFSTVLSGFYYQTSAIQPLPWPGDKPFMSGFRYAAAAGQQAGTQGLAKEERSKRVAAGEKKAALAREFSTSRETLYSYLVQLLAPVTDHGRSRKAGDEGTKEPYSQPSHSEMISSTRSRYLPTCFESTLVRRDCGILRNQSSLVFGRVCTNSSKRLFLSKPFSGGVSGNAGLISASRRVIKR